MSENDRLAQGRAAHAEPDASRPAPLFERWIAAASFQSAPIYRRPTDMLLIGLGLLALVFALLVSLSILGYLPVDERMRAIIQLVAPGDVRLVRRVLEYSSFATIAVAVLVAVLQRHWLRTVKLAVAGLLAWVVIVLVRAGLRHLGTSELGIAGPAPAVAIFAALAVVIDTFQPRGRRVTWGIVAAVALAELLLAAFSPLNVFIGLFAGIMLGAIANLALGVPLPNVSPDAIRAALAARGISVDNLHRVSIRTRESIPFYATSSGKELVLKLIGAEQRDAALVLKLWSGLVYKSPGIPAPFITPMQEAEHEAYMALLARQAGVRTPSIEFTARVDDYALVAQQRVPGRELSALPPDALTDDLLQEIWRQITLLHVARLAHGDLRVANILVDVDGCPWLFDFGRAVADADKTVLARDTAQCMASMAIAVGAERTVQAAERVLGKAALVEALIFLNPLLLSAHTRAGLHDAPRTLQEIRDHIVALPGEPEQPDLESPFRIRKRDLVLVLTLGIAVYVFLPQFGQLNEIVAAWRSANPLWLALGVIGSALTYLVAPFQVLGVLDKAVSYPRFVLAQLAASFITPLAPQGLGGVYILERFVERTGVPRRQSVTAVTVSVGLASPIVHILLVILALAILGRDQSTLFQGIQAWEILAALALVAGVMLILWRTGRLARAIESAKGSIQDLIRVLQNPMKGIELLGGTLGLTLAYIATLYLSLLAIGVQTAPVNVAVVYLLGSVVGSASPTPGQLGVLEGAFIAGLTAFGVSTSQAVAGVLLYRLLTFWLPIVPGLFAFRYLQRKKCL